MRLLKCNLNPIDSEYIDLIPISDLHVGNPFHETARVNKMRQYILDGPNRYTWSLADDHENSTRFSIGNGVYEQTMRPREQRKYLKKWYTPLTEAGKMLGMHESNHSMRTMNDSDFSPQEQLAEDIGTEWLGEQAVLKIQVGNQTYHIHSHHGSCNGGSASAIFLYLDRVRKIVNACDAYVMGHIHQAQHYRVSGFVPGRTTVTELKQNLISCGSGMRYGGYAEMKALQVPSNVQWILRLHQSRHNMEVLEA